MDCIRANPVIYVRNSKDFTLTWKGKYPWKEITSGNWEQILLQHKQSIILSELALWDRQEVYEAGKKRIYLFFKAAISWLPVGTMPTFQSKSEELIKWKFKGDSEENNLVCPVRNILKNSFSFLTEWDCC